MTTTTDDTITFEKFEALREKGGTFNFTPDAALIEEINERNYWDAERAFNLIHGCSDEEQEEAKERIKDRIWHLEQTCPTGLALDEYRDYCDYICELDDGSIVALGNQIPLGRGFHFMQIVSLEEQKEAIEESNSE
ncbi:MAG: hypothetical protein GW854_01700 [Erythrobacter sp.]|nr:hypothetical protein [Erythrobacter sp.]